MEEAQSHRQSPSVSPRGISMMMKKKSGISPVLHRRSLVMKFAKGLDDPEEAWEKVMLSDKTKIQLFGINSTRRV